MPVRDLILRIVPTRVAADMEAESRQWMLQCPHCGAQRSVWDAGGLRYKASSKGKRQRVRCPSCGQAGWAEVSRELSP